MASLLYGLAGKLAGELLSPLFKDYVGKPWELGTKSEFEKIKSSVSAIEAVLLDAEEKQRTNRQVQDWLKKIKRVFYDLEDLLQEVRTEDLKRQVRTKNKKAKKVHIFSKKVQIFPKKVHIFLSLPNQVKYRFKMGRKVKLIRERLDAIASDRNSFGFTFTERKEEILRRRVETHSFMPIDQFVGRHADKECVTKYLLQPDKVSVISINGIGGIGKTTLAQSIYDSEEVKCRFDLRMWVCVSVPFDVKKICENIIESATKTKCDRLQMDGVKDELKKAIDGRKYLLVLDDVWNESHFEWRNLEVLLACGAEGSKILITARAGLVARASSSIETHVLKGLSDDQSWALFKQIAFKRGVEQVNPTMERIGKAIVEKCAGVPLVIKAIGSMLAVKEGETDWLDFEKNDLPRVAQDSEGTVLPILRLSYDNLPAPLKRCFVFCAIYPKDHEIEKKELIGMWMAHGLIQLDNTTRSLEDVGERYFMDLLDRSFFEVHRNWMGSTWYKMHDLIHDLAQSVGGVDYYNPGSGADYIVKSTRHAWVSGDELTNICHDGEKLRTLALTKPCNEQKVNEITSTFEQLRVLRLRLRLRNVPIFVGGLRHLYYLDLSWNSFVSLPESICSLYNLQTLILCECKELEELPAGIRDLVNLRRLDVSGCSRLRYMPRGVEELTCLQTLNTFVAGGKREEVGKRKCAEVSELKSLVNLRGLLAITNLRGSKCERKESCILMELKLVKQLELKWKPSWIDVEEEVEEEEELLLIESLKPHPNLERLIIKDYPGRKVPSWMDRVNIGVSLPNIVSIKLDLCSRLRHVAALGLLPCLQQLHLFGMGGVEYLIESSSLEEELDQLLFPSLKELKLESMWKLKRWVEPTEASCTAANNSRYFPVLEKLQIIHCPLRHVAALGLLPCLQQLHLESMDSVEYLIDRSSLEEEADRLLFPSLKELDLGWMDELKSVVEPTEASQTAAANNSRYFPVLEKLMIIGNCPLFTSLSNEGGKQFVSLSELHLSSVWEERLPSWVQYLPHLQTLKLYDCNKIVSLPEWMGNLTSLQELHLVYLKSLASIPDCLQRLTSLQRLMIKGCYSLASLPDCIQRLTSLQRLVTTDCPKSKSRCEKGTLTSLDIVSLLSQNRYDEY